MNEQYQAPPLPHKHTHTHTSTHTMRLLEAQNQISLAIPTLFHYASGDAKLVEGIGKRETNIAHMKQTGTNLSAMQCPVSPSWLVATNLPWTDIEHS